MYGGRSVEHEISIRSAKNVLQHLNKELFEADIIGISRNGSWYRMPEVREDIESGEPLSLGLSCTKPEFISENSAFAPQVVFPILHGTDGEDGSIQGLLASFAIPFVGSGVLGSAISMDKIISKQILREADIPTSDFFTYQKDQRESISFEEVEDVLGLPFMVKASNLGSSVGISKVTQKGQFEDALDDAFRYASRILIEQYIEGMEVECAIIGNGDIQSTWPGEIHIKKDYDFYTYDAKYKDPDAIEMVVPAPLPESIQRRVRDLSEQAYKVLRCQDYARVDVFVSKEEKVYVNEINTIPGFTSASMFPVMWENMGLEYPDLITHLINLALERELMAGSPERTYDRA